MRIQTFSDTGGINIFKANILSNDANVFQQQRQLDCQRHKSNLRTKAQYICTQFIELAVTSSHDL